MTRRLARTATFLLSTLTASGVALIVTGERAGYVMLLVILAFVLGVRVGLFRPR